MPTYQYACTECEHAFEQVQSFSDDALTECPQCHGRLRKLFNAVGVVFKGSGFYRNDSRGKPASEGSSESTSEGKSDAGKSSDAKSETKSGGKSSDTASDTKKADAKTSSSTSSSPQPAAS